MPGDGGASHDADAERSVAPSDEDGAVTRRQAFGYLGGAAVGLSGWKALDNVVLGYGVVVGTNLLEQDLASYVSEELAVRLGRVPAGEHEVRTDGDAVAVYEGDQRRATLELDDATRADARDLDESFDLQSAPVTELYEDLPAFHDGQFRFEFSTSSAFFDRIRSAEARPATVAALRGPVFDSPDASFVGEFADVDPADTEALVEGLAEGFRAYSGYDVPRYLAGSVEDNVLFGRTDLREHFESPSDFEALAAGENTGLFCTELTARSIEAFHALPTVEQTAPVAAGFVSDQRHKHAYTVLVSAVRDDDGDLVFPTTFVDYTHSTLYDDLLLTWLLGEGIEAYNDRHRASYVEWNRYPRI